jgi:predicted Zn-dependent protease
VIRVVTLDSSYDPKQLERFCRTLYTAFGVGSEHAGEHALPSDLGKDPLDAEQALARAPKVRAYADDKVLYLTPRKLKDRALPSGTAPTHGFAVYGGDKALVSTHGVKDLETGHKLVSRHSMQLLGHLWQLYHCLDPRCAMYPPWTPSYPSGDASFCTFCRDKSDQKIRLAKS